MNNCFNSSIKDWYIFITIIENMSLTKAARILNYNVAYVSKSLAKLENMLGVTLIYRSSKKFEITNMGAVIYKKAKDMYKKYVDIISESRNKDDEIKGKIRLSAPGILCESLLNKWVIDYMEINPGAEITLYSRESNEFSNNSPEFDDLVLKSGFIDSADLIHKKIESLSFGMYASPEYLCQYDDIDTPSDLHGHRILKLEHYSLKYPLGLNFNNNIIRLDLTKERHFISNNASGILNMALDGNGISLAIPSWCVKKHLDNGRLVEVLPEYHLPDLNAYLVWRYRKKYSTLFKDFVSYTEKKWNLFFKK